ncbi:MAG: glycosyltransferase family 9 protein [bacterium]|nr:glycosyltransferase [Candidatus Sumerlaeota bacterium]
MISVVILTRNRLAQLKECIESVKGQLEAEDEILVADTGSTDGTREWLKSLGPPLVSLLMLDGESDFASARNKTVCAANSDIIAFLDDDCTAAPDWLPRIRKSLAIHDAVGGSVLPGRIYDFGPWWSADMCWTIGMTGPGLTLGLDDNYPATANLAAKSRILRVMEFAPTSHPFADPKDTQATQSHPKDPATSPNLAIYMGGREDAQWWLMARQHGVKTMIDPRLIVYHHVPQDRIKLDYVLTRARTDGAAYWNRRPIADLAWHAYREYWASLFRAFAANVKVMVDPSQAKSHYMWSLRQKSLYQSAMSSGKLIAGKGKNIKTAFSELQSAFRSSLGPLAHKIRRSLKPAYHAPDYPRDILVAAPTFLGDSVLILPALQMLTETWPQSRIRVLTKHPEVYQAADTHPCLQLLDAEKDDKYRIINVARKSDIVFAPYYHHGDPELWRNILCGRGVTFDCDVGFPKRRDYFIAGSIIHKDIRHHEILNLVKLFSQWPLAGDIKKPRIHCNEAAWLKLCSNHPELIVEPFVTIQIGTEMPMKVWPVERWERLAAEVINHLGCRVVLIGSQDQRQHALTLCGNLSNKHVANLVGKTNFNALVALLAHTRLAIGVCSGPKHLAMALGAPTFTIYGPTEPARWGALFDRHLHGFIRSPVGYLSPLEHMGLPPNHAMLQVTVDMAAEALFSHCDAHMIR